MPEWREQFADDWLAFAPPTGDALMAAELHDRLHVKQGRAIVRWTLSRGDRRLVVFLKRHFRGNADAAREADHLRWAERNGFRVPRVVAVGEKRESWRRSQSYLALEELTGMSALHEAIPAAERQLDPAAFQRWKRGLIAALAALVARLHALRHFHKDLYLCHFFVPDHSCRAEPASWNELTMIDLHRLGHHRWTAAWWRLKDLAQLLYSSDVPGVTPRDRLRFARLYAGANRRTLAWRCLRWAVGVRWRNYRRHNEGRRARAA